MVSAWRVSLDLDFTGRGGNQWLAPRLMLAASAVLISGPASVSNFQEEPLEITMFNSLSWPPGILPPPSATEKKKKKAGGWKEERRGGWKRRGRENKMVLVRFNVCLPLFPPLLVFHIRRGDLWAVGLAPFLAAPGVLGWRRAGWKLPGSRIQHCLLGSVPGGTAEPRFTAVCRAHCRDSSVSAGHRTHKPGTERIRLSHSGLRHSATSRPFIPSALPCTSLNKEPQKAVWGAREGKSSFSAGFGRAGPVWSSVGSSGGDTQCPQSKGFQRKSSESGPAWH